jgi:tRNA threonylcarbamoyladenosine biosynthesis protein TsaE
MLKWIMPLVRTTQETAELAARFVQTLSNTASAGATIIGLVGDLGAGKTTFVQAAAASLGVIDKVTSPTYILEKIYRLEHARFDHLIHIDAYRLEKPEELMNLGWREISANPKNLIFLEWPERVEDIMPKLYTKIIFNHVDEGSREITIV